MNLNLINDEMSHGIIVAVLSFILSMLMTPIYTYFAYKYKFWKKQKKTTVDGSNLPVITKLHAKKFRRPFPTMAGIIGLVSVFIVTFIFSLDRGQTWLALAGFVGGAIIGIIDDSINIFGSGEGAAGLRGPMKFFLITVVGLALGWFFAEKLEWTTLMVHLLVVLKLAPWG